MKEKKELDGVKFILIPIILLLSAILLFGCSQQSNPPSLQSNAGTATFSLAELAQHNSPADCWIAVDKNVYDITAMLSSAPAGNGQNPLAENCGKEVANFDMGRPPAGQDFNARQFDRNSMPPVDRNFPNPDNNTVRDRPAGNGSFPNGSRGGNFLSQYYIGKLKE